MEKWAKGIVGALIFAAMAYAGYVGIADMDTGPSTTEQRSEERRVYKACMSEPWEAFKDPRTFCREQATVCASALDPDDGAPSVVWDAANDCARRW